MIPKKYLFGLLGFLAFFWSFLGIASVHAATLSIIPANGAIHRGDSVTVYVKINSADVSVNAVQATIHFPTDKLQAESVDSKSTAFGFWLDGPTISGADGTVKFIGGTTNGISGSALAVLAINFKAVGSGSAVISASDAAITANDGKGTNVLDAVKGGTISIDVAASVTPATTEQPIAVTRTPAPATGLPVTPTLRVPLYPDEAKWHNQLGEVIVFWDVPPDVSQLSASIGKSKTTSPGTPEKELFTGKNFGVLSDGVWYVRVQFKNSVGWGPAVYYTISIDTTAPLPFKLTADNVVSENPIPTISYEARDALSGIDHYEIRSDNNDPIIATSTSYKLSPQAPGGHALRVRAVDLAGNAAESTLTINILPLPSPTISPLVNIIYSGEGGMDVSGTGQTGTNILLLIRNNNNGQVAANTVATVDSSGNWNAHFSEALPGGTYQVEAMAQDARGALSLSVKSQIFDVRDKPLFTIGGIGVTPTELVILLLLLLVGGFLAGHYTQKFAKEQRGRRAIIAERDISVVFGLLKKDIDKMLSDFEDGALTDAESKEIEFYLKRMRDNLDKTKRYMSENVEEVKD